MTRTFGEVEQTTAIKALGIQVHTYPQLAADGTVDKWTPTRGANKGKEQTATLNVVSDKAGNVGALPTTVNEYRAFIAGMAFQANGASGVVYIATPTWKSLGVLGRQTDAKVQAVLSTLEGTVTAKVTPAGTTMVTLAAQLRDGEITSEQFVALSLALVAAPTSDTVAAPAIGRTPVQPPVKVDVRSAAMNAMLDSLDADFPDLDVDDQIYAEAAANIALGKLPYPAIKRAVAANLRRRGAA